MKHTKGIWQDQRDWLIGPDKMDLLKVDYGVDNKPFGCFKKEADAGRTAECKNACAGMGDMQPGSVKAAADALRECRRLAAALPIGFVKDALEDTADAGLAGLGETP